MDERTLRQRLVIEVGDEGQAQIGRATASVGDRDLAGEVETRYLAGAGFGLLRVPSQRLLRVARDLDPKLFVSADAPPISVPLTEGVHQALDDSAVSGSCRDVVIGSLRALAQIRRAAGIQ